MFRIFLTNLGKYNEGELVGEWVDLPVDDDFEKAFADIGIGATDEFGQPYEEWFITDYENDYGVPVGEYDNIYELNELAERLENLDDYEKLAFEAYMEGVSSTDYESALECAENGDYTIFYDCWNMEDVAREWVDECGGIEYAVRNPEDYFDYASYGRDIRSDLDDMAYEDWEYEHGEDSEEEFESPYDSYDDYELGEMAVDEFGTESVDADYYFDYEALGRDMDIEGTFVKVNNNTYVEIVY